MDAEITETGHLVTIDGERFSVRSQRRGSSYSSFELSSEKEDCGDDYRSINEQNLMVLDSIKSGQGRTLQNDFYTNVMEPIFKRLGWEHTVIKTKSQDAISKFAGNLSCNASYTIIFISGDTSISEFINNLKNKRPATNKTTARITFLPIPMGTGNAWASSLSHTDPVKSFSRYIRGTLRPREFPLYRALFPDQYSIVFFIIFSLGFHANLLHACNAPEFKKLGTERFAKAAATILQEYDLNLDISVDDYTFSYAYFAIINTSNLELTYKPSPLSDALQSELRLLGYSSKLDKKSLTEKIMQGYLNKDDDIIDQNADVIYKSLTTDFDITLNISANSQEHKFEICCDGNLLNFLNHRAELTSSNKIRIEFLSSYSDFELNVLV